MIVYVECPGCGEEHEVDVQPGEEEVRYLRDGSGCPATPDEAEIVASGCECLTLEPDFEETITERAIEMAAEAAWGE